MATLNFPDDSDDELREWTVDLFKGLESDDIKSEKLMSLITRSHALHSLHLSYLSLSQPGLSHLLCSIVQTCPTLSTLSFTEDFSAYDDDDGVRASGTFRADTESQNEDSTHLSELWLSNLSQDGPGVSIPLNAFAINPTLSSLSITACHVDHASAAIAECINKSASLHHLTFQHHIFDEGDMVLFAAALANNTSLTILDLSHDWFCNEDMKQLADAISSNSVLHTLRLSRSVSEDGQSCYLASMLSRNTTITLLDLSFNHIGDQGLSQIADILSGSTNRIASLLLQWNDFCDEGILSLADMLSSNTSLTSLDLRGYENQMMNDATACRLASALSTNPSLTELLTIYPSEIERAAPLLLHYLERNRSNAFQRRCSLFELLYDSHSFIQK